MRSSFISLCFLLLALLMPLQDHSRDGPADQEEMAVFSAIDLATSIDLVVISLINDNVVDKIFINSAATPASASPVIFSEPRTTTTNAVPVFVRYVELMFKNLRRSDILKEPYLAKT